MDISTINIIKKILEAFDNADIYNILTFNYNKSNLDNILKKLDIKESIHIHDTISYIYKCIQDIDRYLNSTIVVSNYNHTIYIVRGLNEVCHITRDKQTSLCGYSIKKWSKFPLLKINRFDEFISPCDKTPIWHPHYGGLCMTCRSKIKFSTIKIRKKYTIDMKTKFTTINTIKEISNVCKNKNIWYI